MRTIECPDARRRASARTCLGVGYNVVLIPIAMGLYTRLGMQLTPALAAGAMRCSSVR